MENIEIQGAAVVLIGNFNPAIFNPDWLVRQGVVSSDEAAEGRITVIHPELTQFEVGDLAFDIISGRFALLAAAEPFVKLADIVAEIFGEKLSHTPLTSVGINYQAHFRVERHQQTALGRRLAPLDAWGDWGKTLHSDDFKKTGGLTSLTMKQVELNDRIAGNINVTVQPSVRIDPGVYVEVNDHYDASDGIDLIQLCIDRITPSLERSRSIVNSLVTTAVAG
jgi:hypothetical protein